MSTGKYEILHCFKSVWRKQRGSLDVSQFEQLLRQTRIYKCLLLQHCASVHWRSYIQNCKLFGLQLKLQHVQCSGFSLRGRQSLFYSNDFSWIWQLLLFNSSRPDSCFELDTNVEPEEWAFSRFVLLCIKRRRRAQDIKWHFFQI